jgi:hypothetical protein
MSKPTFDDLDPLSTKELRDRAFALAEHRKDIGFFWDLIRHLPSSAGLEREDGSLGGVSSGIAETVGLVDELLGRDLGDAEPLIRARFIDYLVTHSD